MSEFYSESEAREIIRQSVVDEKLSAAITKFDATANALPDKPQAAYAVVEAARAALAVFEKAHTPTDDEREAHAERIVTRHLSRLAKQSGWAEDDTAIGGQAANIVRQLDEARLLRRSEVPEPSVEEFRKQIADERARQVDDGYDIIHDRMHGVDHLLTWAQDYARRGRTVQAAALVEAARELIAKSPEPQGEPSDASTCEHCGGTSWHHTVGCFTGEPFDAQVDSVAKAIAEAANADYWTDEIAEWEGSEEWEREAYPDNHPHTAYEDREEFRKQARAALRAAGEAQ